MATYVVVGLQYGDEGKGKITDVLSAKSDYVVRFQGGDNAGHTVYVGEEKFVLHLLPSGVLQCKGKCIIANGVVVNPKAFLSEIKQIEDKGMRTDHVFIIFCWILIEKRKRAALLLERLKKELVLAMKIKLQELELEW
jgi:adenylosuccinate synthase